MKTTTPLLLALILILLSACVATPPPTSQPIPAEQMRVMANATFQAATQTAQPTPTPSPTHDPTATAIAEQMQALAIADAAGVATATAGARVRAASVEATQTALGLFVLEAQVTGTAMANETQAAYHADMQALAFEREKAKLQREKLFRAAGWVALITTPLVMLGGALYWLSVRMRIAKKRASYFDNGMFILDNGKQQVVIDPNKQFRPTTVIDHTGVTAPQLAPTIEHQSATTAAAFAVQMAKTRSGESVLPRKLAAEPQEVGSPEAAMKPFLPLLRGRHIMITGPTGSGKTHTARYLLSGRQDAYILDPHNKPGAWPAHCPVLGGGRAFDEIEHTINQMYMMMDKRFKARNKGRDTFSPIHLVTDEMPAIASEIKSAPTQLAAIAREGRKVGIFLLLLTQSTLVKELGLEGRSAVRENFATVKLEPLPAGAPENTPRMVDLIVGESSGKYLVPAGSRLVPEESKSVPTPKTPVPEIPRNRPEPGSEEETRFIRNLLAMGYGTGNIAKLLGGRRQDTLQRVNLASGEL